MKAFLTYFFSLLLLYTNSSFAHELSSKDYWDQIGHLYTTSYIQDNEKNPEYPNREELSFVLSVMRPTIGPDIAQSAHLLSLMKDLRVLYGTDSHKAVHLLAKIDRTQTLFGRAALCYQLAYPTANTAILKQRQAIIQTFIDDPSLLADCQTFLKEIQKNQNQIIDFLTHDNQQIPENDLLYMSIMDKWQTTSTDGIPTRLTKHLYSAIAAVNNSIARKINNSEVPYLGSYPLESLMWWRKLCAFWPLGLQIGVTAIGHAYQEPNILEMDRNNNYQLAVLSEKYDKTQSMKPEEWHAFCQQHAPGQPVPDHNQYLQELDKARKEFMQITKVGTDENDCLAMPPGLVTQQARKNAVRTHQKLSELSSFSQRVMNATGMMINLLFNPAHPSRMSCLGWPLKPSEYHSLYGYSVKCINFWTIVAANIATASYIKQTVDNQINAINKIRIYLRALRDIENARMQLYERLSGVNGFLNLFSEGHALSGDQLSQKCKNTLGILQSANLDQSFGVFTFGAGKMLAVHKNLHEVKQELTSLLCSIGEIDLYVSLAQLYKEHATQEVHYTFATFTDTPQASLDLTDVWNPFIDINQVVPNSICLSKQKTNNHMLLTGSNTGGKSTFLRAVALATLMAQTIGMVPANSAFLTPFDDIIVLLNVSDDPTNKESTFSAEGSRARELLQRVNNLTEHQRALIFLDELFKGTSHQEGLKWACAVTHYIARSQQQIITLFATHFHELTHLEQSTDGSFKNYHLDAQRTMRGGYSCSYHLQEGPCKVNIASDIMHQKLDSFDMGNVEDDLQKLLIHTHE